MTLTRRSFIGQLPASGLCVPQFVTQGVTPKTGIVHFGAGHFGLAFVPWWMDKVNEVDPNWGITAVSGRSDTMVRKLQRQDGLYGLLRRSEQGHCREIIGSVVEALFTPDDPSAVVARLADRSVRLVTMTVTQEAYAVISPSTGGLKWDVVKDDAANPGRPKTLLGALAAGLHARCKAGAGPITLMSCDNLEGNSRLLKGVLEEYIERVYPELLPWFRENVAFPVSLIDRMTVTSEPSDPAALQAEFGMECTPIIESERYAIWVVEGSRFATPPWEAAGVKVVSDIDQWWPVKFFGLNAGHSLLAIPAHRMGFKVMADAAKDPALAALLEGAHREMLSFLPAHGAEFLADVRRRFADSGFRMTVEQVDKEGTRKVPKYLVATAVRGLDSGLLFKAPLVALAGWLLNTSGKDERGDDLNPGEKNAELVRELSRTTDSMLACLETGDEAGLASQFEHVGELLGDKERFARLAGAPGCMDAFGKMLTTARREGMAKAIRLAL